MRASSFFAVLTLVALFASATSARTLGDSSDVQVVDGKAIKIQPPLVTDPAPLLVADAGAGKMQRLTKALSKPKVTFRPPTSAPATVRDAAECGMCLQFAEKALATLIQTFLQVGIEGGCFGLCNQLPGPAWLPTVCDLACTVVGVEEFSRILSKADLDTYYFCELVELCQVTEAGSATITSLAVHPKKVSQGKNVTISMVVDVVNATGSGEVVCEIVPPKGTMDFPFGAAGNHPMYKPGTYEFEWVLDITPSEDEPFNPGVWGVGSSFCQGECGSKHPHSETYATSKASFEIKGKKAE